MTDPTNGTMASSIGTDGGNGSNVRVVVTFYDENGDKISAQSANPMVLGLSSLNRNQKDNSAPPTSLESIVDYNFRGVKITGSAVSEHSDGIYADYDTGHGNNPKGWTNTNWDQEENPNFYFGAMAGVMSSGDTLQFNVNLRRY